MKWAAFVALLGICTIASMLLFFILFVALFGDPGCQQFMNLTLCKE